MNNILYISEIIENPYNPKRLVNIPFFSNDYNVNAIWTIQNDDTLIYYNHYNNKYDSIILKPKQTISDSSFKNPFSTLYYDLYNPIYDNTYYVNVPQYYKTILNQNLFFEHELFKFIERYEEPNKIEDYEFSFFNKLNTLTNVELLNEIDNLIKLYDLFKEEQNNNTPCLSGDTYITMGNRKLKQIKYIKKGDFILSHDNKKLKVKQIHKKPYNKKLFKIPANKYCPSFPSHDLFITGWHCFKLHNELKYPCREFQLHPIVIDEVYHIETYNYITDWIFANNMIVETYADLSKNKYRSENMKRFKSVTGLSFPISSSDSGYLLMIYNHLLIELLRRYFKKDNNFQNSDGTKFEPNDFNLCLVGDYETLENDLHRNGIILSNNINDHFRHLNNLPLHFDNTISDSESHPLFKQFDQTIKDAIYIVNKYVSYCPRGFLTYKETYFGTHTLGLVPILKQKDLHEKGYGMCLYLSVRSYEKRMGAITVGVEGVAAAKANKIFGEMLSCLTAGKNDQTCKTEVRKDIGGDMNIQSAIVEKEYFTISNLFSRLEYKGLADRTRKLLISEHLSTKQKTNLNSILSQTLLSQTLSQTPVIPLMDPGGDDAIAIAAQLDIIDIVTSSSSQIVEIEPIITVDRNQLIMMPLDPLLQTMISDGSIKTLKDSGKWTVHPNHGSPQVTNDKTFIKTTAEPAISEAIQISANNQLLQSAESTLEYQLEYIKILFKAYGLANAIDAKQLTNANSTKQYIQTLNAIENTKPRIHESLVAELALYKRNVLLDAGATSF